MRAAIIMAVVGGIGLAVPAQAQTTAKPAGATPVAPIPTDGPLTVESYYKLKWGTSGEFLRIYHKQREALFREMQKQGFVTEVKVEMPFTHVGGSLRWDVRATVTYVHGADGMGVGGKYKAAIAAARARMFPDAAAFDAEEAKRSSLVEDHWDIALEPAP